ncbi:MAG: insulinase family protein [Bacilli bacterium]|nr:insulinase family protein [Bacilli bacterium]
MIKKTIDLIKSQLKNNILKNNEYPQEFLNERLYSSLSDTNLSITLNNGLSYLDEINEYNLYEYYKEFINNQNISVYLSGELDDFIISEFKKLPLVSKKIKLNDNKLLISNDKDIHYINNNFNQNKISCLLRYNNVTDEEYLYTSMIFNSLFGELQDSLLMSNLREKLSLVYYVDSFIRRFDKVIMVNAGFSINNTNKVLKGIKDNLELIKKGEFSESLVCKARESLISLLKDNEASQYKILNNMIGYVNFVKASDKEIIRRYKQIDKKKIIEFAKKIEISKIYILWEEQSGKEA